jgi:hypothetical protein
MEEDTFPNAVMAALVPGGGAAVVPSLLGMLSHGPEPLHRLLRIDIAWVLGNLGSGPPSHVDALVGAGAIGPLVNTLERGAWITCTLFPPMSERACITLTFHQWNVTAVAGAFDLKREAAMALWQLCKDGRHLSSAVEAGALPLFLDLIRLPDVRA